jgi:hypothetical protein
MGMKRLIRLVLVGALSIGWQAAAVPAHASDERSDRSDANSSCHLGNDVKHVFNIVFDNVHFTRDNPNVPSDLEQMPALLNFLRGKGTLLTNEHTPLIAHTATDILTSLTGLYGDGMGVPVSNTYRYFNPDGTTNPGVSFAYWTAPIFDFTNPPHQTDLNFNMITPQGKNTPAPWVPFTRAGCNVGGVSTANIELENIGIDIPTVFGANSAQAAEVAANPNQATADFVGIAVHCAKNNALCSEANGGRADKLPDEPGEYNGYNALFGHKYVGPAMGGIKAMDGTAINGFPGFDQMPANNTLGYVAQLQEHGVPVVYGYISDAHAGHGHFADRPFGPGEADYVAQLKEYDKAFSSFFSRLSKDGINRENSVFVFTSDENDHLIAGPPTPANCDGIHVACTYAKFGEVSGNLKGLVATQFPAATKSWSVHSDSAPNVYITGNPGQNDTVTRTLERAVGSVTATNPYSGLSERVDNFLADRAQMTLMHMMSADTARNPTFTMFAKPDYFLFAGAANCNSPCISIDNRFDWNHGDISPDINVTWLGIVGPDVRHLGTTSRFWTDHSDIRPTLMALTGLKDDYAHQGRPITEIMSEGENGLSRLAAVYKQINAPVGQLSLDSVAFATKAINSNAAGDQTYLNADSTIAGWTARRNALAAQMIVLLDPTAPRSDDRDEANSSQLIKQGRQLLAEVHAASS